MNTYGFTRVNYTDGEFAAYLRAHNALDNYHHVGNSCNWRNAAGETIAIAFFDNANCTREIYIK